MPNEPLPSLSAPTFREAGPFFMAGLREFRAPEDRPGIPGQWQRFAPYLAQSQDRIDGSTYGLCFEPSIDAEGFDYVTAIALRSFDELPEALSGARIPRRRYAIFQHDGHVSTIAATCAAIFGEWQPQANVETAPGPLMMIERYDETFDPMTGRGGIEIWVPLAD